MWQEERRLIHPPCGTAEWEWADVDSWHADHVYCPFCKKKDVHRKNVTQGASADDHAGLEVRLYKLPREELSDVRG